MTRTILVLAGLCVAAALPGCTSTGGLTPQATAALQIACQVDGALQPIAAGVVSNLGVAGASAAASDNLLVHPAVVSACAKLGGTPALVTAGTVPGATGVVTGTVAVKPLTPAPAAAK